MGEDGQCAEDWPEASGEPPAVFPPAAPPIWADQPGMRISADVWRRPRLGPAGGSVTWDKGC